MMPIDKNDNSLPEELQDHSLLGAESRVKKRLTQKILDELNRHILEEKIIIHYGIIQFIEQTNQLMNEREKIKEKQIQDEEKLKHSHLALQEVNNRKNISTFSPEANDRIQAAKQALAELMSTIASKIADLEASIKENKTRVTQLQEQQDLIAKKLSESIERLFDTTSQAAPARDIYFSLALPSQYEGNKALSMRYDQRYHLNLHDISQIVKQYGQLLKEKPQHIYKNKNDLLRLAEAYLRQQLEAKLKPLGLSDSEIDQMMQSSAAKNAVLEVVIYIDSKLRSDTGIQSLMCEHIKLDETIEKINMEIKRDEKEIEHLKENLEDLKETYEKISDADNPAMSEEALGKFEQLIEESKSVLQADSPDAEEQLENVDDLLEFGADLFSQLDTVPSQATSLEEGKAMIDTIDDKFNDKLTQSLEAIHTKKLDKGKEEEKEEAQEAPRPGG